MALVSEKCRVEEGRFFRLYEENARPLVRFFQRKGVPAERARELSQETFLRLCRNTGGLSTARNEKGYLFATARNLWCNTVRDRHAAKRFAEVVSLDETSEVGPLSNRLSSSEPGDNPVDVLLEKERREILRQAIHRLPTMMRLCMARSIYLGETISEIAEALGIAEGTVKSHMFHARARLRSDCTPAAAASTGRRKPPPRNPRQSPYFSPTVWVESLGIGLVIRTMGRWRSIIKVTVWDFSWRLSWVSGISLCGSSHLRLGAIGLESRGARGQSFDSTSCFVPSELSA